jgi:hypothetical protein
MEIEGLLAGDETIIAELDDAGEMAGDLSNDILSMEGELAGDETIDASLSDEDNSLEGELSDEDDSIDGELSELRPGVMSWNGQTGDVTYIPPVSSVNGSTGDVVIDIPTKVSDLSNDAGYISTETDPTVPAWAKQPAKPVYTAEEVGALPDSTYIPETLGDLENDVGYITGIVTDLGHFDMEEYDWDFWSYLEDKIESGFYKVNEDQDGFDYFFRVERTNNQVYQEWWYEEEGALNRSIRIGRLIDAEWEWDDDSYDSILTANRAYDSFSSVYHNHDIIESVSQSNFFTYLNTWNINTAIGLHKITNAYDNSLHYVEFDYRWVRNQYLLYQKWINYNDDFVRIRYGRRSGSSIIWDNWRQYISESVLEDNYYNMDAIDEMFEQFSPVAENMIETTWATLRETRDNGELVKGAWYRITDYNFVTTKLGLQSGNHPFDIVLLAVSESMLSESGYACKHAGDHYFEREVTEGGIEWMYTLYVDDYGESYGDEPMDHQDDLHASDEFCDSGVLPHPDTGDDVPVLYKTATDEYDIDDPDYDDAYFYEGTYDFDGDEFDMWSKYEFDGNDWVFMQQYALTPLVVEDGELIVSPIPETKTVPVNMNAWELKYCLDNDKDLFDWAETEGKGVIYYLKDEFGNEAPYDFKNAMFQRYQVSTVSNAVLNGLRNMYLYQDGYYALTRNSNSKYWYTFASSDGTTDGSLFGECTYNVINPYIYLSPKGKNIRGINNIVLQNANRNSLGHNCFDITILSSADGNIFEGSSNDICGTSFARSTFRDNARMITLYSTARSIYGVGVQSIMGQNVDGCECGIACSNINFGTFNSSLKLGSSCSSITFGQWCYSVDVQNGSTNLTFGNYCSYITIGKVCGYITFTNYYRYINIEDNVTRLTFTTSSGSTSSYVQNVKVCRGISNKSIAPTRRAAYEQIYYATGRIETAV